MWEGISSCKSAFELCPDKIIKISYKFWQNHKKYLTNSVQNHKNIFQILSKTINISFTCCPKDINTFFFRFCSKPYKYFLNLDKNHINICSKNLVWLIFKYCPKPHKYLLNIVQNHINMHMFQKCHCIRGFFHSCFL